LLRTRKLNLP